MSYEKGIIIFSDLDGTALRSDHKFSKKLKNTVKKLYDKGIYFCPITARSTSDAIEQAKKLGLDKFGGIAAANNGSQIYDFKNDEWVCNKYINKEIVKKIMEKTYQKVGKYKCHFFADNETYVYGYGENSKYWNDVMNVKYTIISGQEDIIKPITHLTVILQNNPSRKHIQEFHDEFSDIKEEIDIIRYTDRVYEVCVKGVNKGFAVNKIKEYLEVDNEKTLSYAFGDSHNDFELFRAVHNGIVMGNGILQLHDIAHDVTLTNDDDGVSNYIETNILKGDYK